MIKLKRIIKEIVDTPPAIIQHHAPSTKPVTVADEKMVDDACILAVTIWLEAKGEGEKGMQAILNVLLNRGDNDINKASKAATESKRSSKTGKQIHQFSCWNGISDPAKHSRGLIKLHKDGPTKDDKMMNAAIELVKKALKHQLTDMTSGAKFYFNPDIVKPKWAKKMVRTAKIGHHEFYKEPHKV